MVLGIFLCSSIVLAAGNDSWVEVKNNERIKISLFNVKSNKINFSWSGTRVNGFAEGTGILKVYEDGNLIFTYDGVLNQGKMHGKGIFYTWANKVKYEGDFVDGKANGKGILTWLNGEKYEGDFVDGRENGKGIYTWANKVKYEGDFVGGKAYGKGILIWTDGERTVIDGKAIGYKGSQQVLGGCAQLNANQWFENGVDYYREENYDNAIEAFNKAVQLNPQYDEAYRFRGLSYHSKGQYDLAIDDFTKELILNPRSSSYDERGLSYHAKGQYDLAIADYTKAIELFPGWELAYFHRGDSYHEKGQYDFAIVDYTKAIKVLPQAITYFSRGVSYHKNNQYDLAIADFTKTIELSPKGVGAYYTRGSSYAKKGQYSLALADLNKALELDPQDKNAANARKEVLELLNKSHKEEQRERSNGFWISGKVVADNGSEIWLVGATAYPINSDLSKKGTTTSSNIKIINPDRRLIQDGGFNTILYNTLPVNMDICHNFIGMTEGRNALNQLVPVYVYEYDAETTKLLINAGSR